MSVVYRCDKCGREVKPEDRVMQRVCAGEKDGSMVASVADLCSDCMVAFKRWLAPVSE